MYLMVNSRKLGADGDFSNHSAKLPK